MGRGLSAEDNERRLITVKDRPFEPGARAAVVSEGMTLLEMVAAGLPQALRPLAVVMIGDQVVPVEWWGRIRPKAGARVLITVRLTGGGGGGGGKNPLATVLSLAVMVVAMVAAPYMAAGMASYMGAGTTIISSAGVTFAASASFMSVATPLIGMGISMVGMMAVSALIPPTSQSLGALSGAVGSAGESATLSISGGGNRANPYGVVPRVYGRHRVTPLYCAETYTETVGKDQYLYCLFDCGYGPLALSSINIGDTPIGDYEGVDLVIHQRWKAGDPLKLYRNDTAVSSQNRALTADGGTVVVTSAVGVDEVRVDLAFQGLTRYTDEGERAYREVTIQAAYRAAGSADPLVPLLDMDSGPAATAIEPLLLSDGAMSALYITAAPVAGSVAITVQIPSRWRGSAQLHTVTYSLAVRAESASAWQTLVTETATINAVYSSANVGSHSATYSAAGVRGERLQIRLTLDRQTVWTNDGETALIPGNADGATALPQPQVSYRATENEFTFGDRSAQLVRRAITLRPPSRGQWEIHLTRITPDANSDRVYDSCTISGVVSTTFTPPIAFEETHTILELCIKATDQLSGTIGDLNVIATSILPVWTGTEWVEQECRTPAWIYAQVLRGEEALTQVDDSGLDLAGLLSWAEATEAPVVQSSLPDAVIGDVDEPATTCDLVVDYETNVRTLLTDIAACGRATIGRVEGKVGVVRDVPQTVPRAVITPRNSWGYKGKRVFVDIPHGLRVKYISPEDSWEQAEVVVYADGYSAATATILEDLEVRACTRRAQAWRAGRYALAQMQLRPETHEVQMDVENLIFQRGDLVELVHDVPMQGGESGYVTATLADDSGVLGVTLDETLALQAGVSLRLRHRSTSGALSWFPLRAPVEDTETDTVLFVDPVPPEFAPVLGDLCVVGEAGSETVRCLVKEIWPGADLSARVVLVDEAPAVHLADQGPIPPYDARVTKRPAITPGPVEALAAQVTAVATGGRYRFSVGLSWRGTGTFEVYRHLGGGWVSQGVTTSRDWVFDAVARGEKVVYAVVAVGTTGARLPLSKAAQGEILVLVADAVPTPVENFAATMLGDRLRLTWAVSADTVGAWLRLRWSPLITGATWGTAVDVASRVSYPSTTVEVPARSGTYLAKWVDADGLESPNAVGVVTTAPGFLTYNLIEEIGGPDWTGSGDLVRVTAAGLSLTSATWVGSWPSVAAVPSMEYGSQGLAPTGVFVFADMIDLGAVLDVRVTAEISVSGAEIMTKVSSWPSVAARPLWSGADPSAYDVALEISTSEDDPTGAPVWSEWSPVAVGAARARAFRLRVRLSSALRDVTPIVHAVRLVIDAPDRLQGEEDIWCPAGGMTVTFPTTFHRLGAVVITGQAMASGDTWVISNRSAAGFDIAFSDSSGLPVGRSFDYLAKGY